MLLMNRSTKRSWGATWSSSLKQSCRSYWCLCCRRRWGWCLIIAKDCRVWEIGWLSWWSTFIRSSSGISSIGPSGARKRIIKERRHLPITVKLRINQGGGCLLPPISHSKWLNWSWMRLCISASSASKKSSAKLSTTASPIWFLITSYPLNNSTRKPTVIFKSSPKYHKFATISQAWGFRSSKRSLLITSIEDKTVFFWGTARSCSIASSNRRMTGTVLPFQITSSSLPSINFSTDGLKSPKM